MAGALVSAALAGTVLAGCSGDDEVNETTPADADVRPSDDLEDPYDGPYAPEFREDIEGYTGQEVSLLGEVDQVLSPIAFVLSGEGDVDPILVVSQTEFGDLRPGQTVAVAARPLEDFELTALEQAIGSDLPDEAYAEWDGEMFLDASIVEPRP